MEKETINGNQLKLNICFQYSGRWHVEQVIRDFQRLKTPVNEKTIRASFSQEIRDPDLIIRTSGEERISNFLLWQAAYSELYFTDVFWPSFSKSDFLSAIESYQNRKRRFGE